MPKFRKKPVVIEAEQYVADGPPIWGVQFESSQGDGEGDQRAFVVTAHEQKVYLEGGEWIVPEPDGNGFYPIKADIFEATYEPVEDT